MCRFTFFLAFLIAVQVHAQDFLSIEGKITDTESGNVLPYASLLVYPSGMGSLSNEDGEFSLKVPREAYNDSLLVNLLGYGTFRRKISQLPQNVYLEISLKPKSYELEEVVITPEDPRELIKKAVQRVKENHPYYARLQEVFYREVATFNDTVFNMLETVANTYVDFPKDKPKATTRIKTLKARTLTNRRPEDSLLNASLGGGGLHELLAREPDHTSIGDELQLKSFLREEDFKFYRYEILEITEYQGRLVYVIDFDQDKAFGGKLYQGKIYLDVQTLGFAKISYRFSDLGKRFKIVKAGGFKMGLMKGLLRMGGIRIDLLQHASDLDFRFSREDGLWVPHYVQDRFHVWFKLPKWIAKMGAKSMAEDEPGIDIEEVKTRLSSPWDIKVEHDMLVTRSQRSYGGIPSGDGWTDESPVGEEDLNNEDAYWDQYNHIKPTASLRAMEQKIRASKIQ